MESGSRLHVQLKMLMLKQGERLTFPALGVNGNIIAKVPSERYRYLPEVEFTSMKLAEVVGVEIPHVELVPVSAISGIDPGLLKAGGTVLAVDRFDRTKDGRRVHMEDFMQILDQHPDRKYTAANEETVLNIVTKLGGGTAAFLQGITRIAVNILMGNTDAHLKNWSFYYPNPAEGLLSPAYDIVASHVYDRSYEMALKFRKTHDSRIIGLPRFIRAAVLCGISESRTKKQLKRVVEQAADEWPKLLQGLPMPDDFARLIIARTHELALVREFECVFANLPSGLGN
ncbi:HipA domain-containing protein [Ochrobactrum sp. SFR4]|uniref:type II toxin-antitoxin system HipA family toxin n=1 Tax=Ochrobactrum sp. SFR4 TaxID=2717368 RepID=UPI00336A90DD